MSSDPNEQADDDEMVFFVESEELDADKLDEEGEE